MRAWRAAQRVGRALQLALQLPALARVDLALQPVHAAHQRVHVRAVLRHRRAHLRSSTASDWQPRNLRTHSSSPWVAIAGPAPSPAALHTPVGRGCP